MVTWFRLRGQFTVLRRSKISLRYLLLQFKIYCSLHDIYCSLFGLEKISQFTGEPSARYTVWLGGSYFSLRWVVPYMIYIVPYMRCIVSFWGLVHFECTDKLILHSFQFQGLWFRVQGLGFRIQGLGFSLVYRDVGTVQLWFLGQGLGFSSVFQGSGFRVWGR